MYKDFDASFMYSLYSCLEKHSKVGCSRQRTSIWAMAARTALWKRVPHLRRKLDYTFTGYRDKSETTAAYAEWEEPPLATSTSESITPCHPTSTPLVRAPPHTPRPQTLLQPHTYPSRLATPPRPHPSLRPSPHLHSIHPRLSHFS